MAWQKPDPKEILGFDPAEFKAMKEKLESINVADISAAKTAAENTQAAVSGLAGQFSTLTEGLARRNAPVNNDPPPEIDWQVDPEAAARHTIAPLANALFDTRAMLEMENVRKQRVRDKDGRSSAKFPYWDEYEDEINKLLSQQSVQNRCNRSVIENCYSVVVANKMDEIIANRAKRGANYHLESGANNGTVAPPKDDNQPTEQDVKMAEKFHMKPEDYMKSRKELKYVGV